MKEFDSTDFRWWQFCRVWYRIAYDQIVTAPGPRRRGML